MNAIGTAAGTATWGMVESSRRADDAASRIARDPAGQTSDQDIARAAADLAAETVNFEANVAVLRTGSRMTGRLLDIVV